ncbi:hypothetical protein CDL12_21336 [Handroanthus impetiginosus]|uniref:Uncharacterized protein n=1 Tax=Handroanthus impetiginosus TaxID=429701 RepID=A0A2G9GLD5_9LAMI|nr:hypothetical protein CDL12_21336 [Handroanthus impetiginosus]
MSKSHNVPHFMHRHSLQIKILRRIRTPPPILVGVEVQPPIRWRKRVHQNPMSPVKWEPISMITSLKTYLYVRCCKVISGPECKTCHSHPSSQCKSDRETRICSSASRG